MSISWIINAVLTFLIIFVCFYFANRIVKNSQQREQNIIEQGDDAYATILSMKQSGLFINNNPVVTMDLRVANATDGKTWLLEKHDETIQLITLDAYQVGSVYKVKLDSKNNSIVFIKDPSNGKPLTISNSPR
ncbi:hypothetical protein PYR66_11770 [Klebsiella aerogenes]|nr:hypothetical protein PYR66_11770 [Klebsiella aerogenes]